LRRARNFLLVLVEEPMEALDPKGKSEQEG